MADLSIIIVSYNNLKVITDCLNSIRMHNDIGDQLQVVVVEQSQGNEIYNYLNKEFNWVTIIRNDNNGFGAGNNVGAKRAEAPILLFLNPDTIICEPVFQYAIDKFNSDSRLGMFGVQLLDENHKKNSSFMMMVPYGIWNKSIYKLCNRVGRFDSKRMYIQGADMFIRHDIFERIGGFDEELFMYCEETDLCMRINQIGYRIEYDPSKRIIHLEGKSTKCNYSSTYKKQIESFRYVCQKYNWPFQKILKKEYLNQKLKMFIYELCRNKDLESQKQLVEIVKCSYESD